MYKNLTIMLIIIFLFLILTFYPEYNISAENINNIIYVKNNKTNDVRKTFQILSYEEYNKNLPEIPNDSQTSSNQYLWPLDYGVGQISSVLGHRWGDVHKGWDISTKKISQPIYSIDDGIVIRTGISGSLTSGFGYICCVQYTNEEVGDFMIIYPHMKDKTNLKVGQKVNKGDLIGYTGTTGNSTGIHFHFQMSPLNDYTNFYNPLTKLYKIEMTKSAIESHFGLTFQADALGTEEDQNYNIQHNIDTLLKGGWNK